MEVRSAEIVKRFAGHTDSVKSVAVRRDGRWMVSESWGGTMRRWNVEDGVDIGDPLVDHEGGVWSVAVNEDLDLIASGFEVGKIRL